MTRAEGDEHLAPVTSLFGARRGAGGGGAPGAAAPESVSSEAAASASATFEAAKGDAKAPDASGGRDIAASLSRHPAGRGAGARRGSSSAAGTGDDAWPTETDVGDDETAEPKTAEPKSAPRARLTALPTYAAFAAKSEPDLGDGVDAGSGAGIDGAEVPTRSKAALRAAFEAEVLFEEESESDAESDSEAEPAETLEAATRRAENISLHALSRRGVSSAELASTLRSRDLPDEVVEAEVERLERVGLLNDFELAENLVQTKQDRKGLGRQAISSELRQRGIAQEAIDAALADIDDDEEQTRCDEWAVKRAGQLRGLDQATAERRLNAFLMRRGYRSEAIRRAVEKALPRGGGGGVRFR